MPICVGHGTSVVTKVRTFYVPSAGDLTPAAVVPQDAAVDFQGVAQSGFAAEKILEAIESYQGVGLLNATATKLLEGASDWQGVGLFGATPQKLLEGSTSWQGAGQTSFTSEKVLEASLAFQAVGLIASFGSIIYTSAINFVASAWVTFAGIKPWESVDGSDTSFGDITESDPLVVTPLPKSVVMMINQDGTEIVATELPAAVVPVTQVSGQPATPAGVNSTRPTFTDVA